MGFFDNLGGMMDIVGKLGETKKVIDQEKEKLSTEYLMFNSDDNQVRFEMSITGIVKNLTIDLKTDTNVFAKVLEDTINQANKTTRDEYERRIIAAAKAGLPNIPGLPF